MAKSGTNKKYTGEFKQMVVETICLNSPVYFLFVPLFAI